MKLRSIPQEYDDIIFNGITPEVEGFILNSDSCIYKDKDTFILSNFVGHHGIDIGDILYVTDSPLKMVHIAHVGDGAIFDKYFEVIE